MNEGPEAFERFKQAVQAVLKVPKSALPPSPFAKSVPNALTVKPETPS